MATKRGRTYYVKRMFRGVGKVYKSLGTTSRGRARMLEDMLVSLHDQGRLDLVRAFDEGEIRVEEIAEHYETGKIHELTARLGREDAKLKHAGEAALRWKAPDVKDSTYRSYRNGLAHLQRFAGEDTLVREVLTDERVQEFKAFRLKEGAARETLNNDLIAISILSTFALKRGWIEGRPEIRKYETRVRIRYLEPDQLTAYFACVRRAFRPIFQLLVGTGMRLGEVEELRVCDLRFGDNDARALVEDAKTASGVRPVFIPAWAAKALQEHIGRDGLSGTDTLFDIPRSNIQREHNRARELAGIAGNYTLHDHRHTAAVHLARAGMPLQLLQNQLGHTTIKMTMRYAAFHPDYSDVREYFDRVGERFGVQTSPGNRSGNTTSLVAPKGGLPEQA